VKYFKLSIVFLAFIFIGCSHQIRITSSPAPVIESSANQNEKVNHHSDSEKKFLKNDLNKADKENKADFLDDDFGDADKGIKEEKKENIPDPLAPVNRVMFQFNDKLYFWVLKPVAEEYKAVVPEPVRTGVKNFFHNLGTPARVANSLFQGKKEDAGVEFGRFMVNSTWGCFGFWDPATEILELNPPADDEDLGQTLGRYGIGNGFYLVLPFIGPSTLRDSAGLVGDTFLYPLSYMDPSEAAWGIGAYEKINDTSFRIGDYEALKESAVSPYEAFRDAYIQYRQKRIEK